MSVQPVHTEEEVDLLESDAPSNEEYDALEVMWMERNAHPFHPTPSRPFRAVRCHGITRNGPRTGKRCPRPSTLGTTVCSVHGAQLPQVKKAADLRKHEILLRLFDISPDAMDALEDLALNATSEAVRLKAAESILDRIGVRGGTEVSVTVDTVENAAFAVREKLETLRKRVIEGELAESEAHAELESRVTVDPVDNSADAHPAEENHE